MNNDSSHISVFSRVLSYMSNTFVGRNLTRVLLLAAVISSFSTYWVITDSSNPFGPDPKTVLWMVLIDLAVLLALASVIAWRLTSLWLARRRGSVGSRLQTRIIVMFSLVSVVPTIIIAVFSVLFFNHGIQVWFDTRVGTALQESLEVAEGYLAEHKENIRADILAMATDINNQSVILNKNPQRFKQVVTTQAALRSLSEAIVFHHSKILAKTDMTFSLMFEMEKLPKDIMKKADEGEVVVLTNDTSDRVRALIKLLYYKDTYLMVGRFVDSKVLGHMERTRNSVDEYQRLKAGISNQQIQFAFVFVAVALLLLFAAFWVGMIFAGEFVNPITKLIAATDRVKAGDLDIRVEEGPRNDEIGTLNRAFNRMIGQLQKHNCEFMEINRQIDTRRRLFEAVLSGVSAGVIALNSEKKIILFNRSASMLLSMSEKDLHNIPIIDVFSEVASLLDKASISQYTTVQDDITITRKSGNQTFLVRIVTENVSDAIEGYVITFDDITQLQTAQRMAAWSDVARRIAHEIKNPLTPIHLSASRIKKKYTKDVSEPELFNKYIDTITRHTENIGKIVEEFASFARMPLPKLKKYKICKTINDIVFSEETVNSDINYDIVSSEEDIYINCDKGQISQILTNLLKNSKEAMEDTNISDKKIKITLRDIGKKAVIDIEDNGPGFPDDLLDRITEPYVTTRENGTGLGLAIVKKVVDDHDGQLVIANRKDENDNIIGSHITLSFDSVE